MVNPIQNGSLENRETKTKCVWFGARNNTMSLGLCARLQEEEPDRPSWLLKRGVAPSSLLRARHTWSRKQVQCRDDNLILHQLYQCLQLVLNSSRNIIYNFILMLINSNILARLNYLKRVLLWIRSILGGGRSFGKCMGLLSIHHLVDLGRDWLIWWLLCNPDLIKPIMAWESTWLLAGWFLNSQRTSGSETSGRQEILALNELLPTLRVYICVCVCVCVCVRPIYN